MAITRRDFLQGTALAIGSAPFLGAPPLLGAPPSLGAQAVPGGPVYPPALTGMRGSHPGSFEVAHALAWNGQRWPRPSASTDADYDLIVVGAGLSGLAAAWFYRERVGDDARILLLDNHDDVGGHAKRNEFRVGNRRLIGYGGSQTLENPGRYSVAAKGLLRGLGVDTARFTRYFDGGFDARHGLGDGVLFRDAARGPALLPGVIGFGVDLSAADARRRIDAYPLGAATKRALRSLFVPPVRLSDPAKRLLDAAARTPCEEFLRIAFDMTEEGLEFLRDIGRPLWGTGLDTLSVKEAVQGSLLGMPLADAAYAHLEGHPARISDRDESEPYICHFPDGNASVARLLTRSLVPGFLAGRSMEDVVLAVADYAALDRVGNAVRVRLDSTAVEARNADGGVEVTYVRGGSAERVRAVHCVLACYNNMIPHLLPELSDPQRTALEYAEKVPLCIVNVALRDWRALAASGMSGFYAPGGFLCYGGMDFPVSMGDYAFTANPEDPAVLQFWHAPAAGPIGGEPKARFRDGRRSLYERTFESFEQAVFGELDRAWGRHGLDPGRDVAALTVNRWPHGYAYEYMDLWDDAAWGRGAGPHVIGRQQVGRIAIANSDSEQYAYVNGAIDAAYRAVRELTT